MRVLVAEDETSTAKAIKLLLEREAFTVDVVHDGVSALEYLSLCAYDVVVLDIMMPRMDGIEVLRRMREAAMACPVLLLTAKAEVEDRVAGLNAGADDYLPKPFATSELIARVKALSRRSTAYVDSTRRIADLSLDCNRYEMSSGARSVHLGNKEFQLMELFVGNPGYVFSTEHLYERIWGADAASNIDVVWTHIGFVRRKLQGIGAHVEIKTIRGAGYALWELPC